MKHKTFAAVAAAICLATTTTLADGTLTNERYFAIREDIRSSNNDFYRAQKCRELIGDSVNMSGVVQAVDKYGTILVDLDIDAILSMPDVSLRLWDDSAAARIHPPQNIVFHGTVNSCNYVRGLGTLHLGVGDGHLVPHY
jgi:hypothetical protein